MNSSLEQQEMSHTRRMRDLSKEERAKIMASAAEALSEYYRTDPEVQEWQALNCEDIYVMVRARIVSLELTSEFA